MKLNFPAYFCDDIFDILPSAPTRFISSNDRIIFCTITYLLYAFEMF